jgi:hypothetical protein
MYICINKNATERSLTPVAKKKNIMREHYTVKQ